jgi:hypothetical protein
VWPWKSCTPYRDIVTSQRGHWPLLIRVSGITWRGSKLLEVSRNVNFGTRYVCTCVGAGSEMGGGIRKIKVIRWGAYYYSLVLNAQPRKYDMYKSSLRHINDPVLSSLKMKGIRFFFSYISYTWSQMQAVCVCQLRCLFIYPILGQIDII